MASDEKKPVISMSESDSGGEEDMVVETKPRQGKTPARYVVRTSKVVLSTQMSELLCRTSPSPPSFRCVVCVVCVVCVCVLCSSVCSVKCV